MKHQKIYLTYSKFILNGNFKFLFINSIFQTKKYNEIFILTNLFKTQLNFFCANSLDKCRRAVDAALGIWFISWFTINW